MIEIGVCVRWISCSIQQFCKPNINPCVIIKLNLNTNMPNSLIRAPMCAALAIYCNECENLWAIMIFGCFSRHYWRAHFHKLENLSFDPICHNNEFYGSRQTAWKRHTNDTAAIHMTHAANKWCLHSNSFEMVLATEKNDMRRFEREKCARHQIKFIELCNNVQRHFNCLLLLFPAIQCIVGFALTDLCSLFALECS